MTIALVGTVQTSQGSPATHAAITGIANGDLYVDLAHDTGGTAPALDATSTFTTLGNGTDSGGRTWLYGYRIRTGTEGTLSATGGAGLANIFFGLTGISGVESFASTNNTSTIPASTPTADNCWHIIVSAYTSAGGNIIATPPSGYTLLGSSAVAGQGTIYAYYKDLGAGSSGVSTGTVAVTWTFGSGDLAAGFIIKSAASGPTVTSVTQTSGGTEGSPAVMTVSLSGATSGSKNFAATLAGVTATGSGTDFTSDLSSATYSNGVTFSGGNMVVPDDVSGWTVTISTKSDTLDEANETATLTVGGTAGTLTITDDDAAPTIAGTASSTVTAGDPVVITYSPGLSGQTRTYTLALTDGTAVGGTDYDNTTVTGDFAVTAGTGSVSISGSTVTVDPGVTEFTLTITTTA